MFGDFREMVLHYFLADNTIEILEKIPPNSGRDAVSMFLRRANLPKEPVPHCQPGVQTKRTVLNVFGPTGHGGRYILDSLKVHVHYKSILMWNIHTVLLHMYCISQIPSHVRVSRQTFCNDENFVNQTLNFTVLLMESNSIALSLSLSLSLQTGAVETEHYDESDLTIGAVINSWGRRLLLCDCDEFTKEFYRTKYGIGRSIFMQCSTTCVPQ